jgi:hypothetical protein
MASSWSDNSISLILCHRVMNCLTSFIEVMRCSPCIHFSPCNALATVKFFFQAKQSNAGASSVGAEPWSHRSCKKLVCWLFPSLISVHTLNNCCSTVESCSVWVAHGLVGRFHFSHRHLSLSAQLNRVEDAQPTKRLWPLNSLPVNQAVTASCIVCTAA